MSTRTPPLTPATPAELQRFAAAAPAPATSSQVGIPVGGATISAEPAPAAAPAPATSSTPPPNPVNAKGVPESMDLLSKVLSPGQQQEVLSQEEKDIFFAAVMHRRPVRWNIALFGGRVHCAVESITDFKTEDLVLRWLEWLQSKKRITSMTMWATHLQRAHVFLRVKSITREGQDTETLPEVSRKQGRKTLSDMEWLDELVSQRQASTSPLDFSVFAAALAVHERKLNLATRMIHDGSFWGPAGTN